MYKFTKQQRLLKNTEFKAVQKTPLYVSSAQLLLLARPNNLGRARLGLIVAKRHIKPSVGRNRIKRIAREAFRVNAAHFPPIDIIVLTRHSSIEMVDNATVRQCLDDLLLQLKKRAVSHLSR